MIWDESYGHMNLVGFESDLESDIEAVEILLTSLLVRASHAMLARSLLSKGQSGRVVRGRGLFVNPSASLSLVACTNNFP